MYLCAAIQARLAARDLPDAVISEAGAGRRGFTAASVSRLLSGEAAAPRAGWDVFAEVTGEALEVDPIVLWQDALALWQEERG